MGKFSGVHNGIYYPIDKAWLIILKSAIIMKPPTKIKFSSQRRNFWQLSSGLKSCADDILHCQLTQSNIEKHWTDWVDICRIRILFKGANLLYNNASLYTVKLCSGNIVGTFHRIVIDFISLGLQLSKKRFYTDDAIVAYVQW